MARLRRSHLDQPGISRRGCGRGFRYLGADGRPVDEATVQRIRKLAVPPAWTQVWICPWPNGHIQAVGRDAAGRLQYRYHDDWTRRRGAEKFVRAVEFGRALAGIRTAVDRDLQLPGLPKRKVLALAVRLLDLGLFRPGGEEYAEENGSYGLATLRREHVRLGAGKAVFTYPAKSGQERLHEVSDPESVRALRQLKGRRGGGDRLLGWREDGQWTDLHADQLNAYLKEVAGESFSAKDFRTWGATVLAATLLATAPEAASEAARKRSIAAVYRQVSEALGNTPAVCRKSYVDPRVVDCYRAGDTIFEAMDSVPAAADLSDPDVLEALEEAVLGLLAEAAA